MVPDGGGDAAHPLLVLDLVDGEAAFPDSTHLPQHGCGVGERVLRAPLQGLHQQHLDLCVGQSGEQGLADAGAVQRVPRARSRRRTHRLRAVHRRYVEHLLTVEDAQEAGLPADADQLLHQLRGLRAQVQPVEEGLSPGRDPRPQRVRPVAVHAEDLCPAEDIEQPQRRRAWQPARLHQVDQSQRAVTGGHVLDQPQALDQGLGRSRRRTGRTVQIGFGHGVHCVEAHMTHKTPLHDVLVTRRHGRQRGTEDVDRRTWPRCRPVAEAQRVSRPGHGQRLSAAGGRHRAAVSAGRPTNKVGTPRAPARARLSLLPSGPGEVHRVTPHEGSGTTVEESPRSPGVPLPTLRPMTPRRALVLPPPRS